MNHNLQIIIGTIEAIVKHKTIAIYIFFLITIPTFIFLLLASPVFVATSTILPEALNSESGSPLSTISGGSIRGILLGTNSRDILYAPILESRRIITKILSKKYTFSGSTNTSLLEILEIEGDSLSEKLYKGYDLFINSMLEISTERENGITTVQIASNNRNLSVMILKSFIHELDKYLRNIKLQKGNRDRIFINSRLDQTLALLQNAEEELKEFRETNKRIENSPELQLKHGRLRREIKVQEEVYLALKKELEIAKIEEVKSLPIVRILDEPIAPIYKSRPNRRIIMLFTTLGALIFAISISIGIEYYHQFSLKNQEFILKIKKYFVLRKVD